MVACAVIVALWPLGSLGGPRVLDSACLCAVSVLVICVCYLLSGPQGRGRETTLRVCHASPPPHPPPPPCVPRQPSPQPPCHAVYSTPNLPPTPATLCPTPTLPPIPIHAASVPFRSS
ncbi:hypothetical protein FKM82_017231 [Ascaphus truei]